MMLPREGYVLSEIFVIVRRFSQMLQAHKLNMIKREKLARHPRTIWRIWVFDVTPNSRIEIKGHALIWFALAPPFLNLVEIWHWNWKLPLWTWDWLKRSKMNSQPDADEVCHRLVMPDTVELWIYQNWNLSLLSTSKCIAMVVSHVTEQPLSDNSKRIRGISRSHDRYPIWKFGIDRCDFGCILINTYQI